MKRNAATAQTCYATLALSRDGNPSASETSSDSDIVTALRQMGFSLLIFIPALMASVLVHFSFSALIFNLCLRKMVFCGYFISDQADTLLRATLKEVSNMNIGRDNVNTFKLIYLSVTLMCFFSPKYL